MKVLAFENIVLAADMGASLRSRARLIRARFHFGEPEDLVPGLLYPVSPGSDWVTGHTLNIDGGWIPRT
jgi:NAD(P)-dependent dehydrogenase (short-subunit alcohol dehydrogenase family)